MASLVTTTFFCPLHSIMPLLQISNHRASGKNELVGTTANDFHKRLEWVVEHMCDWRPLMMRHHDTATAKLRKLHKQLGECGGEVLWSTWLRRSKKSGKQTSNEEVQGSRSNVKSTVCMEWRLDSIGSHKLSYICEWLPLRHCRCLVYCGPKTFLRQWWWRRDVAADENDCRRSVATNR